MQKQLYADVIVDISAACLDRSFQYKVPEELRGRIQEGSKVIIPFGKGDRKIYGFVVSISSQAKIKESSLKTIEACPQEFISAKEKLLKLAVWMRGYYGSTFIQALKTVLPVQEKKKIKTKKVICAKMAPEELEKLAKEWERKHYSARVRLLNELIREKSLPWERALKELKLTSQLLQKLEEKQIISIVSSEEYRDTIPKGVRREKKELPSLNEEQERVYQALCGEFQKEEPRPCLIRGITGSGKTQVYMKLIEKTLREGKEAILLIPEISLTWQTVSRFYACFGEKTAVLHSRLSKGEKSDLMERVRRKEVSLVIGPRSALFTPFENLGIIIIDEEHDSSYQSEKTPRYHAREVAEKRAAFEKALLVLGSATPSLESRYRCEKGEYFLAEMNRRFAGACMPEVRIVDMRRELQEGRRSMFSLELEEELSLRIKREEQSILFLNRRGHTGFFTCRSCGNVVKCPHCDISLTYHNNGMLMCHYCGFQRPMVKLCPSCGSPYIGGFRVGTQKVEEELKKMLPKARVLRMDRDTTGQKESHEKILKEFAEGKADILVGTQMIVKGHDFPKVTLVGALAADTSLNAGDYRAAEETFQLLVQAAGRAGRGKLPGLALIQTYNPEHYALKAVQTQDYESFYQEEILNRQIMGYPPASCMLAIHGSGKKEEELQNAMNHIRKYLDAISQESEAHILGPVAENVAKVNDMYRFVIYIKHDKKEHVIRMRQYTEKYISINSGFDEINIQFALNS